MITADTLLPEWKGIKHHILAVLKDEGVRMEKEKNQPRKVKVRVKLR